MVHLTLDGEQLVVRPQGLHQLWAFRQEIRVPRSAVRSLRAAPGHTRWPSGLRFPGTFLPGVITAGSYLGAEGWEFWDLAAPERAVVIELADGAGWRRLVVEVEDPTGVESWWAEQIGAGSPIEA